MLRNRKSLTVIALFSLVCATLGGLIWFQVEGQEPPHDFSLPRPFFARLPMEFTHDTEQQQLRKKLQQKISLDCIDLPLSQVVKQLARDLDVTIVFDPAGLEEASVVPDQKISIVLPDLRGTTVLRLLLGPLNLTYTTHGGVVQVTSVEKASEQLETRLYQIRDLLASAWARQPEKPLGITNTSYDGTSQLPLTPCIIGGSGRQFPVGGYLPTRVKTRWESAADEICDLITSTISPDAWSENGGSGSITVYRGLLAVSQTEDVHVEVELLLEQLRRVESSRPGDVIVVP